MVPAQRAASAALDRAFRSRPLVFFLAAWVLGILAGDRWGPQPVVAGAAGTGLVALCLLVRRPWPALSLLLLGVAFLGIAAKRLAWQPPTGDVSRWAGQQVVVWGTVTAEPRQRCDVWRVVLQVESVEHAGRVVPARGSLLVTTPGDLSHAQPGDRLWASGIPTRPSPARNPGGFSRELWLARQRVFATMSARAVGGPQRPGGWWHPARWAAQVRHRIAKANRDVMSDSRAAALVNSLLFGDLDQDDARQWSETEARFRRAGLSHVLVVSGAQVALLFGLLYGWRCWALRPHRRLPEGARRRLRFLGGYSQRRALSWGLALLLPYLLLTGFELSLLRASLMAAVFFIARCLDRENDPENSLAGAALLLLVLNPLSLYDIGGQLSFAAFWGIMKLTESLGRAVGWWRSAGSAEDASNGLPWGFPVTPLASVLLISLAAQLATTPLVAQHFHHVSLIGLLANPPVCLLAAVLLPLGLFTSVASSVLVLFGGSASSFAHLLSCPTEQLARLINWIVEWCAKPEWAAVPVFPPGWGTIAVYAVLLLITTVSMQNRRRWVPLLSIALALLLLGVGMYAPARPVRVPTLTFVDVGQGDACLLRLPDGTTMLVDGGGSPRAPCRRGDCESVPAGRLAEEVRTDCLDVGRDILASFLRHERVRRIDLLVLSHPDDDHQWGLNALLSPREGFGFDTVLESGFPSTGAAYREWQKLLEQRKLKRITGQRGMQLRLGPATLDVLHPPVPHMGGAGSDTNNNSVVLRLEVGGTRVLLPGDAEASAEASMRDQDVSADVLKVAHHGSATSTSGAWLDRVRPRIAVISCGASNPFGHPHPVVEASLNQRGVRTFRTDRHGAVTLELTPGGWRPRPTLAPTAAVAG